MNYNKLTLSLILIIIGFIFPTNNFALPLGKPEPTDPPPHIITINDVDFDISTGTIIRITNEYLTDIIIPDTLEGVAVKELHSDCFISPWVKLESIEFPPTLVSIGDRAFNYCNFSYLKIPKSVEYIGYDAFSDNPLDSVHFEANSMIQYIGEHAFATHGVEGSSLTAIVLPTNANQGFKGYRGTYYSDHYSLYSVGDSIVDFVHFYEAIIPYTLKNEDVRFDVATGELKGYNTPRYFGERDIIIPDTLFGVPVITIGDKAFNTEDIKSLVLPDSLKYIRDWAFGENKIREIVIPKSIVEIGYGSFLSNDSLYSLKFEDESNLRIIHPRAFDITDKLKSITLPTIASSSFIEYVSSSGIVLDPGAGITDMSQTYYAVCPYELTADEVVFDSATGSITEIISPIERAVIIPDNINGVAVKSLGMLKSTTWDSGLYAMPIVNYKYSLVWMSINSTVEVIADRAFEGNQLYRVSFEDNSMIKEIWYDAFNSNPSLKSLTLPHNANETFIEYRDADGNVLNEAYSVTDFTNAYLAISPYTMQDEDVNNTDENDLESDDLFSYINKYERCLVMPDLFGEPDINSIEKDAFTSRRIYHMELSDSIDYIGESAFENNLLLEVNLPEGMKTLGISAFAENKIGELILPSSIATISRSAFYKNRLTSIDIPQGVKVIEYAAFANNSLTSVAISNTVEYIETGAFAENPVTSIPLPDNVIKEGYEFTGWNDGNGNDVTEINTFNTSYRAQFAQTGFNISGSSGNFYHTIRITGDVEEIIPTSDYGYYNYVLNPGRNVVITPISDTHVFTPESITITDIQKNMYSLNFEAELLGDSDIYSEIETITVHPNPVNEFMHIEAVNTYKAQVLSLTGQVLITNKTISQTTPLNVKQLTKGIYIIFLEDDNGRSTSLKIIKK